MAVDKLVLDERLPVEPEDPAEARRLIEEARADMDRRGGIPHEEVKAWFRALRSGRRLARPQPRKGPGEQ